MERLNLNNEVKYKNTSLSNSINTIGDDASYDDACKRLLSHKEVLARILKECVS
jgi:hypothetical protein